MVRPGDPKSRLAQKPMVASHYIFQCYEHGVADVEFAGNIGWRYRNYKRLTILIFGIILLCILFTVYCVLFAELNFRSKISRFLPSRVDFLLVPFSIPSFTKNILLDFNIFHKFIRVSTQARQAYPVPRSRARAAAFEARRRRQSRFSEAVSQHERSRYSVPPSGSVRS